MRKLYIETLVRTEVETLWQATQDPVTHASWDLRFTRISPHGSDGGLPRFRYATRVLPLVWMTGDGVHAAERHRPDGTRTSVLRFRPDSRLSPLGRGSGYWRYIPTAGGIRFFTGYDYEPAWGRAADLVLRPLIGWATAWSFDRLRLWLERGLTPRLTLGVAVTEVFLRLALVVLAFMSAPPGWAAVAALAVLVAPPSPLTPAARRCTRRPPERIRP